MKDMGTRKSDRKKKEHVESTYGKVGFALKNDVISHTEADPLGING